MLLYLVLVGSCVTVDNSKLRRSYRLEIANTHATAGRYDIMSSGPPRRQPLNFKGQLNCCPRAVRQQTHNRLVLGRE